MGHKHIHVMFIDEDKRECDCCDKKKITASISIFDNVIILCKDCLLKMAKEFE